METYFTGLGSPRPGGEQEDIETGSYDGLQENVLVRGGGEGLNYKLIFAT